MVGHVVQPVQRGYIEHCIAAHLTVKLSLLVEVIYGSKEMNQEKMMWSLAKPSENQ